MMRMSMLCIGGWDGCVIWGWVWVLTFVRVRLGVGWVFNRVCVYVI